MPPGFPYGDKIVFVANDWHAGLVPSYIAGRYRRAGVYKVSTLPCSLPIVRINLANTERQHFAGSPVHVVCALVIL